MTVAFRTLTANIVTTGVRRETLHGQTHLVVPMVMMTPGVRSGSDGAILYEEVDMLESDSLWDHKPIVDRHPTTNGRFVSAADPAILNTQQLGIVLRTKTDGKQRAEAWLNEDLTKKVNSKIIANIEAGQVTELSTGLFMDMELVANGSKWTDGKEYKAVARKYRPDHLAILTDEVGACSIADGAGLLVTNAASFSEISCQLHDALSAKYGKPGKYWDGYVLDVYTKAVVFRDEDYKLWQAGYTVQDDKATLTGEPVEVRRVTEYRTVDGGKVVTNVSPTTHPDLERSHMDKKKIVDGLIANTATSWKEADREFLTALPEDRLSQMAPVVNADPPAPVVPPVTPPAPTSAPVPPAAKPAVTVNEFLESAPAEFRPALRDMLETSATTRQELISKITANAANPFTADDFAKMSTAHLKGLAAFATPAVPEPIGTTYPLYLGANAPVPTTNAGAVEPLVMPEVTFGK